MNRLKELFKNKQFLYAALAVASLGLFMYFREKNQQNIVYAPVEEEPTDYENADVETSSSDLYSIVSYVQDWLNESDSYMDSTSEHYEGQVATTSEIEDFFGANIPSYTANYEKGGYKYSKHFVWHFNGQAWVLILSEYVVGEAEEKEETTPTTTTPTTKTTTKKTTTKKTTKKYVTVGKWKSPNPPWNSYLIGIAKHYNMSLAKLLSFPENKKYRANPNLIHPGDRVRVK